VENLPLWTGPFVTVSARQTQAAQAQSTKLSTHNIRFIFACQEEFVEEVEEEEFLRPKSWLQTGRTAGVLASRPKSISISL